MAEPPAKKCSHFSEVKLIDPSSLQFFSYHELLYKKTETPKFQPYLCLTCGEVMKSKEDFFTHHEKNTVHNILINLINLNVVCYECNKVNENGEVNFNMNIISSNEDKEKIKIYIQYLVENKYGKPFNKYYTKEEIYSLKYKRLIESFKQKKFKNIIFMTGAGISTSAGIPDFRSKTGLFKQVQDKYHFSTPEEFFNIKTFFKKPEYYYEFWKLFDLSNIKPTITHKFLNYFIQKNNVKYLFTQNTDGLEIKAKIPQDKIIFAHGSDLTAHCPKCHKSADIEKVKKGIEKQEIVYCDTCKNVACKPQFVFYGESLPERFFEKMNDVKDCDLVIIMGTSLKVYPFRLIPDNMNFKAWKVVMNYDEVGEYDYNLLSSNSIFIQGKTDDVVLKFLKDIGLEDDFKQFIKETYGDEEINKSEKPMISV